MKNNNSQNVQAIKLNLKNMHLIQGLQHNQKEIALEIERIKTFAEQGYKLTLIPEFKSVIKNTNSILSRLPCDYVNCQIYLIQINSLLDTITLLESKLISYSTANVDGIIVGLKEAVHQIGFVFSAQAA